jgi:hypothetical protein
VDRPEKAPATETGEDFADPSTQRRHGTLSSFAQQRFEFAESLLDGVEIAMGSNP